MKQPQTLKVRCMNIGGFIWNIYLKFKLKQETYITIMAWKNVSFQKKKEKKECEYRKSTKVRILYFILDHQDNFWFYIRYRYKYRWV